MIIERIGYVESFRAYHVYMGAYSIDVDDIVFLHVNHNYSLCVVHI